jgi:hypothetical protein
VFDDHASTHRSRGRFESTPRQRSLF